MRPFLLLKKKVIKIRKKAKQPTSVQEWSEIKDISKGKIIFKDNSYVKIIEIQPINFELKSEFEKESILEGYKRFLKSCNFNIQIVMQSQLTDVSKHFEKIKRMTKSEKLKIMADEYMSFIQDITCSRQNVSRKFYIIIKGMDNIEENILKIKEGLGACGNITHECTTEDIILIMKNCLNKRLRGLERIKA